MLPRLHGLRRVVRCFGHLGAGIVAVWLYFGLIGLAHAQDPYGVVTVDLRPSVGEVPTHVCVVSGAEGPRTRIPLSKLLRTGEGGARIDVDAVASRPDAKCSSGDGTCAPRVRIPGGKSDQLHVACTEDALLGDAGSSSEPRVLTMLLEHLEGSPPLIESLSLTGGVLTIGVRANLPKIVVTARSLGGHYEAHDRSYRAEQSGADAKLVVLPITPRCRTVSLELPGARLLEAERSSLVVEAHGQPIDVDRCVAPLRGGSVMRATIARARDGEGQVRVTLPSAAKGGEPGGDASGERPGLSFVARWDSEWPARNVELAAQQIQFRWQPPACVWDTSTCPAATLESGIGCVGYPDGEGCTYTCPGSPGTAEVEVSTPVAVTFTKKGPTQSWNEILQRPGQLLTSYVPTDQVYLTADISDWVTSVPGSRISHVEILGADGSTRRYPVEAVDELRVLVAGASCEPVRYRLVGERRYREASAKVRDGHIQFGEVEKTARVLTFNFTLLQGGGPAFSRHAGKTMGQEVRTPVFFTGLVQLAGSFRPRNPKWSRIAGELRLGGTVGQWGWYGRSGEDDETRRVSPKIPWMRFLAEPAIAVDVYYGITLSAGVGIGWSWPLRSSDVSSSKTFRPIISPSLDARFTVRRWLAFVAQARMVFMEELLSADFDPNTAQPVDKYEPATSLLGIYGVQFNF